MAERLYTMEEIKDFLKEEYDLDWRNFEIISNGRRVCIKDRQFNQSCLSAPAVVYRGKKLEIYWINVSNVYFRVYGKNNQHKSKRWQKLLENKNKEHNQDKTL